MTAALIAALIVGAFVFTRLSGLVIRRLIRRMAERGAAGLPTRWWRVATGLYDQSETGLVRRRQRVSAAARMVNHLVSIVVWIVVTIAVFHVLDVDVAFFLSSAGFLGFALALGGQHKVNDYLTGLAVLFEDRYGVGDELIVDHPSRPEEFRVVVDHIGLFTTRLRDKSSTVHVPNGSFALVRNLSQRAQTERLRLHVGDNPEYDLVSEGSAAETVRQMAGSENLTGVMFLGDLGARRTPEGDIEVEVHTARPLKEKDRQMIKTRAEQQLRGRL